MSGDENRMSLGEHVEELRRRLIRVLIGVGAGMILCFVGWPYLWQILIWPLPFASGEFALSIKELAPGEGLMVLMKTCMITGAILSAPYGLYQIWKFVAAGLYDSEKRAVRNYIVPSMFLFAMGVAFFFLVIAPLMLKFFVTFTASNFAAPSNVLTNWLAEHVSIGSTVTTQPANQAYVGSEWRITDYIHFVAVFSLVFGIAFETPLVVVFLGRTGIVPVSTMRRYRKYVLVVIMILSAIITPTDWFSMVALAVPMYALYEIGLIVAALGNRRHKAA